MNGLKNLIKRALRSKYTVGGTLVFVLDLLVKCVSAYEAMQRVGLV